MCGIFEATGWPGVVAVVGNWFGHAKKGLIMGIWNSHTSVGNIVGASISGRVISEVSAISKSFHMIYSYILHLK